MNLIIKAIAYLVIPILLVVFSLPIYFYIYGIKRIEKYLDPPTTSVPSHILTEYKNWLGRPIYSDYRKLNPYSQIFHIFLEQWRRENSIEKYELSDLSLYVHATRRRLLSLNDPINQGDYTIGSLVGPIHVSRHWTVDQLISEVLDNQYYGNHIYGYEDASKYYFGVAASELSAHQLFALFHIPEAPSRFNLWCDMEGFKLSLEFRLKRRDIEYDLPLLRLANNSKENC